MEYHIDPDLYEGILFFVQICRDHSSGTTCFRIYMNHVVLEVSSRSGTRYCRIYMAALDPDLP